MDHEEYIAKVQDRVVTVAQAYLSGDAGVVETARALTRFGHELGTWMEPDFITFTGIDSETDALAVGPSRQYWAADAFVEEDRKIAQVEAFYREDATASALGLIARYGHT
jgi:hypothetical protein